MTIGVVVFSLFCGDDIWMRMAGLALGGICFLFSYCTREALGYGDSWLILILGIYLGIGKALVLLTVAFLLAGLVCLVGLLWKRWQRQQTIAFIPFLTVAYVGVLLL